MFLSFEINALKIIVFYTFTLDIRAFTRTTKTVLWRNYNFFLISVKTTRFARRKSFGQCCCCMYKHPFTLTFHAIYRVARLKSAMAATYVRIIIITVSGCQSVCVCVRRVDRWLHRVVCVYVYIYTIYVCVCRGWRVTACVLFAKVRPPFSPGGLSLTPDFGQWPHYFRSGEHQFRVIINPVPPLFPWSRFRIVYKNPPHSALQRTKRENIHIRIYHYSNDTIAHESNLVPPCTY